MFRLLAALLIISAALPAALPDKPLAQSLLGWPLSPGAKAQLAEALEAHPGCDLLYQPLFRARDGQAFKDYFAKAAQDAWVLLYLLRERDTYGAELTAARMDAAKLLERLLWANGLPPKADLCPWAGPLQKVEFDGYSDEVTDECYSFVLTYRMDGQAGQISIPWCGPLEKDAMFQEITGLMKRAGVPLLHRSIIQQKNADELKLPPSRKSPPPDAKPK